MGRRALDAATVPVPRGRRPDLDLHGRPASSPCGRFRSPCALRRRFRRFGFGARRASAPGRGLRCHSGSPREGRAPPPAATGLRLRPIPPFPPEFPLAAACWEPGGFDCRFSLAAGSRRCPLAGGCEPTPGPATTPAGASWDGWAGSGVRAEPGLTFRPGCDGRARCGCASVRMRPGRTPAAIPIASLSSSRRRRPRRWAAEAGSQGPGLPRSGPPARRAEAPPAEPEPRGPRAPAGGARRRRRVDRHAATGACRAPPPQHGRLLVSWS